MMVTLHDVRKPLRAVVAAAIARGWVLEETGRRNGHTTRLRHPSGRLVPLHHSKVSEGRAPKKLGAQLRRIERSNTR